MQMSEFRWDDVRVFLALMRTRSLLRAGQALGVNASTVGRRIDALEAALDVRLFDRTRDGVRPTAAAEQLLPAAEDFERAAVGVAGAAEGFEREPEGTVRLTGPPGVIDEFVAPAVGKLAARYPRLRLELDASIGYADLTRREADLALRGLRPSAGDLVTRKLGGSPYVVIASKRYARALGTLADPADARWIAWGPELAHIPSGAWLEQFIPPEAVVLRTNSMSAQLRALEHGVGVALHPAAFTRVRSVVEVPLAPAFCRRAPVPPEDSLWLVGHRALRDVPRVAAVWDFILAELERMAFHR